MLDVLQPAATHFINVELNVLQKLLWLLTSQQPEMKVRDSQVGSSVFLHKVNESKTTQTETAGTWINIKLVVSFILLYEIILNIVT